MKDLRKALIVSVMTMTVFSMSMIAVPFQADAAAQAGDLIKMDGLSSVYFLGGDDKRYVFPNESTYFSWYSDFSGVVTVPQSELESYPLGANVTVRPGTELVKITTDPKVYAVLPGGDLKWVPSEDVAKALWGDDWAMRVIDVPDAFFTNYSIASGQLTEDAYPAGSLVKMADAPDVYYIAEDGKARKVTSEAAFLANRFQWDDIIVAQTGFTLPTMGDDITGAVAGLIDTSEGAGGTPGAGTGLTVSIAGDTPAAGNIPDGSPVDFLKINLTASNDGAVNVSSMRLKSYDLSLATNLTNIAFYDNGVKVGTSKNMTSDREAIFNFATPIKVEAGSTKSLMVRATIAALATGNYAIGIEKAADIITNGAVVSGAFPIIGNSKSVVTGVNIGAVTMTAATLDGSATAKFGEDNVLLAAFSLRATNEDVLWQSVSLRNGGSSNTEIIDNMRMEINGDIVVEGVGLTDRYAIFNLNNYLMKKNETVTVEVYGDIGIANLGNEINLYVREATDFVFTGREFGFGIEPAIHVNIDAAGEGIKVTLAAGSFTIDMDKSATPAQDVRPGTNDVVIATIKMLSNSENATTNGISGASDHFIIAGTGLYCNRMWNVVLRDKSSGAKIDLTVASSTTANTCLLTTTEEISFAKGVTRTFELMANLYGPNDTNPIVDGVRLQATLDKDALTLTGDESDAPITDITPSTVSGSIITVRTASLTWTTVALTEHTVVPGATDVVVYEAGLKAGASSEVELMSVRLDADNTDFVMFDDTNISKLDLYLNGKPLKSLSNQIQGDGLATAYINFTSLESANRTIPKGETYVLQVKASFAGTFALSGTETFALEIADLATSIVVRDVDNNTFDETVANVGTDSRKITLASTGSLKVQLKTDNTKANRDTYVLAGTGTTADRYLGELVITTANEPVKVTKLALGRADGANFTSSDVLVVRLYNDAGTVVAEEPPSVNGHVYFDSLNLELEDDTETSLWVGVVTKSINASGDPQGTAAQGKIIAFNLATSTQMTALGATGAAAVEAEGVDSGEVFSMTQTTSDTPGDNQYEKATSTTKVATVSGSVLTSIVNAMSDGAHPTGNNRIIGKYTFVFDNGANRTTLNQELKAVMTQLALTVATSSGVTVSNVKAYNEADPTNTTAGASVTGGVATITGFSSTWADSGQVDGTVTVVITANVAVTGSAATRTLQTSIEDLTGGDFVYTSDGATISNPRLNIVEVSGATLQSSL